jgi:hypothetical protein
MPIYHSLHNPSFREVLAPFGFEPVQVRSTAALVCGVAALALGYAAYKQYRKAS